jgi:prolyl-tRNA synthetase
VIAGSKSEAEKFAGAVKTYSIEAMMQDGKALQAGTSHDLGQNFAKAFDVTFQDENGERQFVWATSWGVSTRLLGAVIMVHSDNKGLVIPPRIAATHMVVIPIWYSEEDKRKVISYIDKKVKPLIPDNVRFIIDDRDQFKAGWKFHEWEKRGIPIRLEVGPRDVESGKIVLVHRFNGNKTILDLNDLAGAVENGLIEIQDGMFRKALDFREAHTEDMDSYDLFKKKIETDSGFYRMHWCGDPECELKVKDETKATIRSIPFDMDSGEGGKCVICGKPSKGRVIFAKAY